MLYTCPLSVALVLACARWIHVVVKNNANANELADILSSYQKKPGWCRFVIFAKAHTRWQLNGNGLLKQKNKKG